MEGKNKTLCFSGHRTGKMPRCKNDVGKLKQNLYSEIDNVIVEGYEIFLFGACYGFDLTCAEMVQL